MSEYILDYTGAKVNEILGTAEGLSTTVDTLSTTVDGLSSTTDDLDTRVVDLEDAWDSISQKKKLLWSGTWDTDETITIPNITQYNHLIFVTDEWVLISASILPNNSSYLRASVMYPSSTDDSIYVYSIRCKSDSIGSENWTLNEKNLMTISPSGNSNAISPTFTIMRIYGVA